MPTIELSTTAYPDAQFLGNTSIEAGLGAANRIRSNVNCLTSISARLRNTFTLVADIDTTTTLDMFLRLNDETNKFLEADVEGISELSANLTSNFNPFARFEGNTLIEAVLTGHVAEVPRLRIFLTIIDSINFPANIQAYTARLLINETAVPITRFNVNASRNVIGTEINVSLARVSDRSLVISTNEFSLDLGFRVAGVTQWIPVLDAGSLVNDSYSLGWANNSPTDQASFGSDLSLVDKLGRSPEDTTIIYDSTLETLTNDQFEPLVDTQGNSYGVVLVPTPNLTLYGVLDLLMGYCEFLGFKTNIPDYRIRRVDIQIGEAYFDGIKGLIGVYEPVLYEKDGYLHIVDTTTIMPDGFPSPKSFTASQYQTVQLERQNLNIEGFILEYSEDDKGWDYFTLNTDTVVSETGSGLDYLEHTTTTVTREYRRSSRPSIIVKTDILSIEQSIRDFNDDQIHRSFESFAFDYLGRVTRRQKEVDALIPWLEDVDTGEILFSFQNVRSEFDTIEFAQHSFQRDKQYRKQCNRSVRGLIYVDSSEYLGSEFRQDYLIAHRSGNIDKFAQINREFGPISTMVEKCQPKADGTADIETRFIDHIANITTVDKPDNQAGEVALNSLIPITRRVIVYETESSVRGSGRLQPLSIGEIPANQGIALCRRLLKKYRLKGKQLTATIIGVDQYIQRGAPIRLIGRDAEVLGDFIVVGYNISGNNLGQPTQTVMTTIEAEQI